MKKSTAVIQRSHCVGAAVTIATLIAGVAGAADLDRDGVDDAWRSPYEGGSQAGEATIAVINTGDHSVGDFIFRLSALGYTVTTIPVDSKIDVLRGYAMVLLPVRHADYRDVLNQLAQDYHDFVGSGGCLYIAQPNQSMQISWAPHDLVLDRGYDYEGCERSIEDPDECAARGLAPEDLPYPFDTVVTAASEWRVLVTENGNGSAGALVSSFGLGSAVVDLGNPEGGAFCEFTDEGLLQMVTCCIDRGPVPVIDSTWGSIKSRYREPDATPRRP